MAEEKKKKRGFLSKLGFKSKDEKLAEAAAEKAAQQKLVDEQMAARMAAINAAALKSAREQDEADSGATIDAEEQVRIEAEEKRQAEIQAAKDVARAKQLAEEKARKEEEAKRLAEEEAARQAEAKARAEELAEQEAEAKAKADAEAKARAEEEARIKAEEEKALAEAKAKAEAEAKARAAEEARIKAEEEKALATAKSDAEAAALKAKQEVEAKARAEAEAKRIAEEEKTLAEAIAKAETEAQARAEEEARRQAEEAQRRAEEKIAAEKAETERLEAEALAAEKAKEKRLREEALEAERRAKVAAQAAEREAAEKAAKEETEAKRIAELKEKGIEPEPEPDTLAEGGFLRRITKGLSKSTSRMSEQVSAVFTKRKLDDDALQDLEDILITSDFGVGPAAKVAALLAEDKFDKQVTDMEIKIALADVISDILTPLEKPIVLTSTKPQIMLFVGVNGSGKTTTLGKLAKRYHDQGKTVMIAAGDTFRAAAVEQLTIWSERAGAKIVSGKLGSDAAGLVYDAIEQAKTEDIDILMIDTAGRLQNRTELMDELAKVVRVIKKQDPSAPHHSILVLDATVGQNALMQTEAFKETAGVTGLIMTKLDGTAKGGVLVALSDKYKLPIHAIGIGERIEDLENFSAPVFAAALSGVADAMLEG